MDNSLNKTERYDLLCRALFTNNELEDKENIVNLQLINKLYSLLENNFMDIIKLFPHTNFLISYNYLKKQIDYLSKLILFPPLLNKGIIAFGGGFSSGKSSLINSLLGKKLLISNVQPTTNMPTYIFAGEKDDIFAINLKNCCINITTEEFQSLTHLERDIYNSEVSKSLLATAISSKSFSWNNLVFMDTPGYSGSSKSGSSDKEISLYQFNFAQILIWVVNAKNGVISASDIEILNEIKKVNNNLPKLVLLTRADQLIESELKAVIKQTKDTLERNKISVLDVLSVSNKSEKTNLLKPVFKYLDSWNNASSKSTYIECNYNNIKKQLESLRDFLNNQQDVINKYFAYVNKLKFNPAVKDDTTANIILYQLDDFEKRFFINLDKINKNLSRNSYKIFYRKPTEFPSNETNYEDVINSINELKNSIDKTISPIGNNLKTLETKIDSIANEYKNELTNTILNIKWDN